MLGHTLYAKQLNLEPRWTRHYARVAPKATPGIVGTILRMLGLR